MREINFENISSPDDEVINIMREHDLDQETAENVRDVMDEYDVDEYDAIEIELSL